MGKYDPLRTWLSARPERSIELDFSRIERILSAALPASAHVHAAWWANDAGGRHVQANAWLEAGFVVTSVDRERGVVAFERRARG